MKKIFTFVLIMLFSVNCSFAKNIDTKKIKFNGTNYYLLYSAVNPEHNGYLNEYYKLGETYNLWSEMVALHQFPNAYSPLDRVKKFREYLASIECPSALTFNDKKNIAMIDFLLIQQIKGRTLMEFNIFKYQKSNKSGSNALQYARRYVANNAMEVEYIKRDFEKNRKKLIKKVNHMKLPEIIETPIDLCKVENEDKTEGIKNKEPEVNQTVENNQEEIKDKELELKETTENTQDETTSDAQPVNSEEISTNSEIQNESVSEEQKTSSEVKDEANVEEQQLTIENDAKIEETAKIDEPKVTEEKAKEIREAQVSKDTEKIVEPQKQEVKEIVEESKTTVKEEKTVKSEKQKKVKKKKQKQTSYTISNEKDEYYTKPKKPRKVKKKDIKKRAKNAAKKLNETL